MRTVIRQAALTVGYKKNQSYEENECQRSHYDVIIVLETSGVGIQEPSL